MKGSDNLC
ncbi:Toxin Doc, partial [Haemophilus influenzae]